MRPHNERQEGDGRSRVDHRRITEQWFATERWNNRRNYTESRQDNDVNLGMAKEPEDMLEQDRIAAAGGVKETGAKINVHEHHGDCAGQNRHNRDKEKRRDQPGPDKQRHFHQSHARCAQIQHRRDDVDRAHD